MHVIEGGYVGVAPLGEGRIANVTMVLTGRRMEAARSDPRGYYRHVLREHPELRTRLAAAAAVEPVRGLGPLACRARRFSSQGIALVGDACGFVDPFTAEGVSRALESARMLADAIAPACAAGRPLPVSLTLPSYESAWRERFEPRLALCRMLQTVIARPWLAGPVARGLSRRKELADRMIAATGDLLPAASVMSPSYLGRLLLAGALG
jgi:flavin-dependent dehydrogenase